MGLRVRFTPTGAVVFFCPHEGGDRHANLVTARRWFTLFFIPIIPLNVLGHYVQCTSCNKHFDTSVLDRPTTSSLGQVLANAVRVLTVMVVGGGDRHHPAMRAAAVRDIRAVVADYDDDTLTSDLGVLNPTQAEEYVHPLADGLEVEGKERFVADLTRVALAGGTITPNQRWLLDSAGRGIGLTPVHVTGIVSSVTAASTPDAVASDGTGDGPPAAEPPTSGTPPIG